MLEVRAGSYGVLVLFPPPQARFREFLLKPSLFVMRRNEVIDGDLPVVRGVASSTVVPGSAGSYRPVIAGAKLREGITTILPRGGERSRESACLQCAFTPLAGARRRQKRTRSMVHRRESHPLSDRPEIAWPCRT